MNEINQEIIRLNECYVKFDNAVGDINDIIESLAFLMICLKAFMNDVDITAEELNDKINKIYDDYLQKTID